MTDNVVVIVVVVDIRAYSVPKAAKIFALFIGYFIISNCALPMREVEKEVKEEERCINAVSYTAAGRTVANAFSGTSNISRCGRRFCIL